MTSNSELIKAFCFGLETSSLETLFLQGLCFRPEQEAQVVTALARHKTLVHFGYRYSTGPSPTFCDNYCVELSKNIDTKLERLNLYHFAQVELVYDGIHGHGHADGVDGAIATKIRNLLTCNVQRKTCPPLFAAIGSVETDIQRKYCLVEAFEAVDIPVAFEYITANQDNLIELIQRLGRSRKPAPARGLNALFC